MTPTIPVAREALADGQIAARALRVGNDVIAPTPVLITTRETTSMEHTIHLDPAMRLTLSEDADEILIWQTENTDQVRIRLPEAQATKILLALADQIVARLAADVLASRQVELLNRLGAWASLPGTAQLVRDWAARTTGRADH